MVRSIAHPRSAFLFAVLLTIAVALPYAVHAQESSSDVRAAIRSELANDPRTAGFSETQINAMVDILLAQAQKDGLSASDITWQPQQAETFDTEEGTATNETVGPCDSAGVLCKFSEAFGFVGPLSIIPFILGATSMALIWIFAEMLHKHRMRMHPPVAANTSAPLYQ